MSHRTSAEKIFTAGVRSVLPEKLVTGHMKLKDRTLTIHERSFCLDDFGAIYIIGAGKASAAMAHYAETILGDRITGGHVVVKYGHSCKLKKIEVTEAGHPIPDSNGFRATREILKIARQAGEKDLVICLISGGGSALLADLPERLLPEDLYIVNNLLIRCGASIDQINCVRKHLSQIKGGQLTREVWPATLVSMILSDVIGNPLDVIASGPTVPDSSSFSDALQVIRDYQLTGDLTAGILNYLNDGLAGIYPETPKPGDPIFAKTFNILAGTNLTALEAARSTAVDLGYNTMIIDSEIHGDVNTVAGLILDKVEYYRQKEEFLKPACLLFGGEPTVRILGNGLGGRNQHLALTLALRIQDIPGITLLSAGTDGTDGPTDVAGAVVDSGTVRQAMARNKDPGTYLSEFDSYNFFKATGGHIRTGPTFTNVMDLVIAILE